MAQFTVCSGSGLDDHQLVLMDFGIPLEWLEKLAVLPQKMTPGLEDATEVPESSCLPQINFLPEARQGISRQALSSVC